MSSGAGNSNELFRFMSGHRGRPPNNEARFGTSLAHRCPANYHMTSAQPKKQFPNRSYLSPTAFEQTPGMIIANSAPNLDGVVQTCSQHPPAWNDRMPTLGGFAF